MGRIGCSPARAVRALTERVPGVLALLFLGVAVLSRQTPLLAQEVIGNGWVNIVGLGPVKMDDLPAELRDNIRIPGQVYEEQEEEIVDLPATPAEPDYELMPPVQESERPALDSAPAAQPIPTAQPIQERIPREELLRAMYEQRSAPGEPFPHDIYQKAWEYIQKMPPAVPTDMLDPQSWFLDPRSWLARFLRFAEARRALAQSAQWTNIGPAPFRVDAGSGQKKAGIVCEIEVDPSNSNRVFLGTFGGGVWRTTDGGTSWTTTTDGQPSLQISAIEVHPTNSNLVFVGTGQFSYLNRGFGVLRSTDGGSTWCQIGPTYLGSQVAVVDIDVDNTETPPNPARVWAATSSGLWYSTNAANTATACASVTWTLVAGLPTQGGGAPNHVRHIFVSPLNRDTLYTAIVDSGTASQNGWWRSINRGTNWTQINGALANPPGVSRAAIAQTPNQGAGTDLIYAIMNVAGGVQTMCGYSPPVPQVKTRLYRGLFSNTSTSWTVLTVTKSCQVAADCCDDPPLGCYCANASTGAVCQAGQTCTCEPNADCGGFRSVQVDFSAPNIVAVGTELLYRSTNGGVSGGFKQLGRTALHDDHNALVFDPADPNVLLDGNDGGFWKSSPYFNNGSIDPTWINLNGNLANIEFHRSGVADKLNEATSAGGTQDNGYVKGGNPVEWDQAVASGDGAMVLVDPKNANVLYLTDLGGGTIDRSLDGGLTAPNMVSGLPLPIPYGGGIDKIAMDPSATPSTTLVTWSRASVPAGGRRMYRTTSACDGTPTCGATPTWSSITGSPTTMPNVGNVSAVAIAPSASAPSSLIFAGTDQDLIWRTTNANTWTRHGSGQLPTRLVSSFAIPSSPTCTPTTCTVYASFSGANSQGGVSGHVFRSTDAGQNWSNISSSLPDIPVTKVVIDPSNANVLYVATDMGIYKGTFNGSSWVWATFNAGFPASAAVTDLSVHPESGMLRAYTFGRSAWEYPAFSIPNPDLKANTTTPVTGSLNNSTRIGASNSGQFYSVAWADDRNGANNYHVYFRAYQYVSGNPSALTTTDLRIDDTSTHVVGAPGLAAHPTQTTAPYCSRFAWHDDRLAPGVNHIYNQYMCSDGFKLFVNDVRVDQHDPTTINATNAAITNQQDNSSQALDYAIVWQADRSGSSLHDIYARFFNFLGGAKGNQIPVNTAAANVDAITPATASDPSLNAFIAWEEFNTVTLDGKILISKYNINGVKVAGPVMVNSTSGNATERHEVALAVDAAGNVIASWWEHKSDGTQPESVYRRRFTNALGAVDTQQVQVDQSPALPTGVRDLRTSVATDTSDRVAITWLSTKNDLDDDNNTLGNIFARTFDPAGSTLKNDFRIDVAPRSSRPLHPRVARSSQTKKFAYAWRDDRTGKYEIYTRVVPSIP